MIDEITSLFDFWLKANTSEPHRQLALLVAREILRWHYDSFEKAKASLEEYACHRHSCKDIVDRANLYRDLIRYDKHTERYITADEARKSFEKTNIGDYIISLTPHHDTAHTIRTATNTASQTNEPQWTATQTARPPAPGDLLEYGLFDREIEDEIEYHMGAGGLSRDEALIRVFTDISANTPANTGA